MQLTCTCFMRSAVGTAKVEWCCPESGLQQPALQHMPHASQRWFLTTAHLLLLHALCCGLSLL